MPQQWGAASTATGPIHDKGGMVYDLTAYGIAADGTTDDTALINTVMAAASAAGGGRVRCPAGKTIRGAGIKLYPGIIFDIPKTAKIKLLDNPTTSLITNCDAAGVIGNPTTDIGIVGGGELDGNQANVPQINGLLALTAPTVSLGSGGALSTGNYIWSAVAVSPNGRTVIGNYTAPTAATAGQKATLTPPTGAAGTTSRELYRCVAGGTTASTFYLVATIANNTAAQSVDDTVSDVTLVTNQVGYKQSTEGFSCIGLAQVTRFHIADLYIHDARQSAIGLTAGCTQGTIRDVRGDIAGNDVFISISNYDVTKANNGICQDIKWVNCHASNGGGTTTPLSAGPVRTGFEVGNDCRDIAFANCTAELCADAGFVVNNHPGTGGPYNVTYTGCHVRDCGTAANANTGGGYGFYALAQDVSGPDGIEYTGCTVSGGVYGFRSEESTITATSQLGNVTYTGCYAGGYLTNSSGTVGTADPITTAGYWLSYRVASPTAPKAVVYTACTAEGISAGNGFLIQSQAASTVRTTILKGCTARGCTGLGFTGSNVFGIQMSTCTADGNTDIGFNFISGMDRAMLTACVARNLASSKTGFQIAANNMTLNGCYADIGASTGFNVATSTTATTFSGCVARLCQNGFVDNGTNTSFSGCKAIGTNGSGGAGFLIQNGAHHTLSGCVAQDSTGSAASGVGIKIAAGTDITIDGCTATGNSGPGLFYSAVGAVRVLIANCRLTNNSTYGLRLGTLPATGAAILVQGCILTGNATAAVQYTSIPTDGSLILKDCQGVNPTGAFANQPAIPSSTVAYTYACDTAAHAPLGLPPATVHITGGTVTVIAVAGTTTGLTSGAFRVTPGQTVTLTYSVAPTWQWFGD